MMRRNLVFTILLSLSIHPLFSTVFSSAEVTDHWKTWLDEVRLIMTNAEREVFKNLKTEEDRRRFQNLFWQVRDSNPETTQNEYKAEFYSRLHYAEHRLEGANSDRGRIYILLGEPREMKNYSGYDTVVDCELWMYQAEGRPGLPPFMYILFYKPGNFGNYRLFHPGPNSALDVLSLGQSKGISSKQNAYNIIRRQFPELARATISIIPDEGNVGFSSTLSSSGTVIANIHKLPEKEVEKGYLRNFSTVEGVVDVSVSTKEINGNARTALLENRGLKFLSYALIPEVIHTEKIADNVNKAQISLNIRLEDSEGKTIHQQEREFDLQFSDAQIKSLLKENKLVFKDFTPVVEGKYSLMLTFTNKTAEEFFVHMEELEIPEKVQSAVVGYKIEEIPSDIFLPFSTEKFKVHCDPLFLFNKEDNIEGIVLCPNKPVISLTEVDNERNSVDITDISQRESHYLFKHSLTALKSGNYFLTIKSNDSELYSSVIAIMPYTVKKTIGFERTEELSSRMNFMFLVAQQYLNCGKVDTALEYFHQLPSDLLNATTRPVIARAYYLKKDHSKVIELLENGTVEKTYPVLLLLANSSLELKKLREAADYFEKLREYGDTAKINQTLGAIYHTLGEREKAKLYWERAKDLEKPDKKKQDSDSISCY
ncbi:MAG: GWxTD domain-containing protein [Candidatus Aminicenantes bacterium]|nr:GWxTD domain-containing protein [Candidatus Aminicenantes bacterium]